MPRQSGGQSVSALRGKRYTGIGLFQEGSILRVDDVAGNICQTLPPQLPRLRRALVERSFSVLVVVAQVENLKAKLKAVYHILVSSA
jgi:hypothetical protein